MTRYWVSWWSGYYADEGCTEPPFQTWISGERDRVNADPKSLRNELSFVAVIDAKSEAAIWKVVKKHYRDFEERFCEPKEADFTPNDRFPDFENKTSLTAKRSKKPTE